MVRIKLTSQVILQPTSLLSTQHSECLLALSRTPHRLLIRKPGLNPGYPVHPSNPLGLARGRGQSGLPTCCLAIFLAVAGEEAADCEVEEGFQA